MSTKTGRIDWADVRRRLAQSQAVVESGSAGAKQHTLDILRRRSVELATRPQSARPVAEGDRLLVCSLGEEQYGVELRSVREVLPLTNCTPVPGAPPELLGVINLRGKIRSVICLARILRLAANDVSEREAGYIAVVQGERAEVALRVDRVEHIALVCLDSLESPGDGAPDNSHHYVRGVTADGVIVLDLAAIITDLSLTQRAQ